MPIETLGEITQLCPIETIPEHNAHIGYYDMPADGNEVKKEFSKEAGF